MKAAISIPDDLFEAADALARRLGLSRSRLYANALADYVARHRGKKTTDVLNRVYGSDDSGVDPVLKRAQKRAIGPEPW